MIHLLFAAETAAPLSDPWWTDTLNLFIRLGTLAGAIYAFGRLGQRWPRFGHALTYPWRKLISEPLAEHKQEEEAERLAPVVRAIRDVSTEIRRVEGKVEGRHKANVVELQELARKTDQLRLDVRKTNERIDTQAQMVEPVARIARIMERRFAHEQPRRDGDPDDTDHRPERTH